MTVTPISRPRVAVHKFSSCDGCQLAFLNLGTDLLTLADKVELVHFAEAGPLAPDAEVDLAFIEGSISTPEDLERIQHIRNHCGLLVAIGACATAGGVQALRNGPHSTRWLASLYSAPEQIASLPTSTPISAHVKVDLDLPGCPVTSEQVLGVVNALLLGVSAQVTNEKVCVECKRKGLPCVMVSKGIPCMGPVTHGGCGALCPSLGRDCYGCFGPAEPVNTDALTRQFKTLGLNDEAISRRFSSINNNVPAFASAARKVLDKHD